MIYIDGGNERMPSVRLRAAVAALGPHVQQAYGLTWRVIPRFQEEWERADNQADWYETVWSIEVLCKHGDGVEEPLCQRNTPWMEMSPFDEYYHVIWQDVSAPSTFRHPNKVPAAERMENLEPVNVDVFTPEQIKLIGGRELAAQILEQRRELAITQDHSAEAFDWPEFAERLVLHYRTLTPPTTTFTQRVKSGGVRLFKGLEEVRNAEKSLKARMANAIKAGEMTAEDCSLFTGVTPQDVERWIGLSDIGFPETAHRVSTSS